MKDEQALTMKPIPTYPDYFATDDGTIWSMKPMGNNSNPPTTPRKMKKWFHPDRKRFVVTLHLGHKERPETVARLVLMAFMGLPPAGMIACHGTMGRSVDSLKNLYWGTYSQNNGDDRRRDGTMVRGENHHNSRLNELQVRIIRRAYSRHGKNGISGTSLAHIFNVTDATINRVIKRECWNHI